MCVSDLRSVAQFSTIKGYPGHGVGARIIFLISLIIPLRHLCVQLLPLRKITAFYLPLIRKGSMSKMQIVNRVLCLIIRAMTILF